MERCPGSRARVVSRPRVGGLHQLQRLHGVRVLNERQPCSCLRGHQAVRRHTRMSLGATSRAIWHVARTDEVIRYKALLPPSGSDRGDFTESPFPEAETPSYTAFHGVGAQDTAPPSPQILRSGRLLPFWLGGLELRVRARGYVGATAEPLRAARSEDSVRGQLHRIALVALRTPALRDPRNHDLVDMRSQRTSSRAPRRGSASGKTTTTHSRSKRTRVGRGAASHDFGLEGHTVDGRPRSESDSHPLPGPQRPRAPSAPDPGRQASRPRGARVARSPRTDLNGLLCPQSSASVLQDASGWTRRTR